MPRPRTIDCPSPCLTLTVLADGTIALYSGNAPAAYAGFGPDFDTLTGSCTPTLVSIDDPTAASFLNQSWLSTVYRDGDTFHAIVHNGFHDPVHPNCKAGDTSPANACWYNALTYATSGDGRVFSQPAPNHVVAGPPQVWDASGPRAPGPYGTFSPSSIQLRDDGLHLAMFFTIPDRDDPPRRGRMDHRRHPHAQLPLLALRGPHHLDAPSAAERGAHPDPALH